MKHHPQRNLGCLLIGIGLLWIAFGIYGLMQPDEFRSYTRIVIAAPDCGCLVTNEREREDHHNHLHEYYTDLIKTIPPEAVLSNVTSELNLTSRWNKDRPAAINLLRLRLNVQLAPNTKIIEIGAVGETPSDAALIANTVVASYQQWSSQKSRTLAEAGVRELEKQLTLQDQKVRDAEIGVNRLKVELNIPSPEPSATELQTNYPAFLKAKRYQDEEKDVQRLLARKINIEKADLLETTPHNFLTLEIIERAAPPTSPMRRKNLLSIILLAAGLGCCLWGLTVARDAKLTANPG